MSKERIIGLFFSISLLLAILFLVLTPQIDYQQEFVVKEVIQNEIEKPLENDSKETKVTEKTFKPVSKKINSDITKIDASDFDLFVIRVHVLSSKENASKMVEKLNESGLPAFTEIFGSNNNLHAIYVGPFLTEDDINSNMDLIQEVSESKNGEISRWKL
jgi:cell division septation protein DedD